MASVSQLLARAAEFRGYKKTARYRPTPGEKFGGATIGALICDSSSTASVFECSGTTGGSSSGDTTNCMSGRLVLKICRADDRDIDSFKTEVRALLLLTSAASWVIPALHAVGTATAVSADFTLQLHPWFTADHCGTDLHALLYDGGFGRKRGTTIAAGIARAVAAIHAAGIVHCDIKSKNVLIAGDSVKIIDFGSSKIDRVMSQKAPGTRDYRAPEIIRCDYYDTPADVWSLGVLVFEIFTGFPPFDLYGDYDVIICDGEAHSSKSDASDEAMSESGGDDDSNSDAEDDIVSVEYAVADLTRIYNVVAAPEEQDPAYTVNPVPVPIGLVQLIELNTDLEIGDSWYISDIVAPMLRVEPDDRATAAEIAEKLAKLAG